jgi:hypothetical protein
MAASKSQASLQSSKVTGVGASCVGLGGTSVFVTGGWSGVNISVGGAGVDVMTDVAGALLHPATNITTSTNAVIRFIHFELFIVL